MSWFLVKWVKHLVEMRVVDVSLGEREEEMEKRQLMRRRSYLVVGKADGGLGWGIALI